MHGSFLLTVGGVEGRDVILVIENILVYRAEKKFWYMVARNFFLLLLNFSAWPCLGPA